MKAIITGVNGQDGFYLSQLLKSKGIEVIGISRSGDNLRTDLTSLDEVTALIGFHRPDYIFHLAAQSTTRHDVWLQNNQIIGTGTLNLLEGIKLTGIDARIFIAGSGLQFRNEGRPIRESDDFDPSSPYAVSRIHATYAARYYRKLGIKAYVGFFFNHDSPMRGENHMAKKISEAVKRIAVGSDEKLVIGDLATRKEWGFAGDIVEAVWVLLQQEKIFEAVIGTGEAHSIQDWIEFCFSFKGIPYKDHVENLSYFMAEYKVLVSDPTLIKSMGWQPKVGFAELAQMMLQ